MTTDESSRFPAHPPLSYRGAGVDIAAADGFVGRVKTLARKTHTPAVVHHPSAYAGLVRLPKEARGDCIVAATCDGVGTKLLVAREMGVYRGLGQDLVAMNVNDLLPLGARPVAFLDYVACGKLDPEQLEPIVAGMADACTACGCALIAGETAEMPGLYASGDFDLAGFALGVVAESRLPKPNAVSVGDVVLALPSSGIHANGFSLARAALLERAGLSVHDFVESLGAPLGEELLKPTRLYVEPVMALPESVLLKAAAHVTGGGLVGRAEKLLGIGQQMDLDLSTFSIPPIFELIAATGAVSSAEMWRTFNMGLGFLAVVDPGVADQLSGTDEWRRVGNISRGSGGVRLV